MLENQNLIARLKNVLPIKGQVKKCTTVKCTIHSTVHLHVHVHVQLK